MALLEIDDVSHRFGGSFALDRVSLTAERGQVTGVIGPNGAGKTTLFEVITGGLQPEHGAVRIDGHDLGAAGTAARARLGIGRTFQRLEPFGSLTTRESIELAASHRRDGAGFEVDEIVDLIGLGAASEGRTDQLPTGHARLAELGRALAIRPRLLLLDEPASGLDDTETGRLSQVIRTVAERGIGVVLVEHDIGMVMRVCDVIHVLDRGTVIATGPPAAIRDDPKVRASYLGTGTPTAASTPQRQEPRMTTDTEARIERFDREVTSIVRAHDPHHRMTRVGTALMTAGILVAVIAYFIGHRTTDPFVQNDAIVISVMGVCVTLSGVAVYLRHGLALGAPTADSSRRAVGNSSRVSQ